MARAVGEGASNKKRGKVARAADEEAAFAEAMEQEQHDLTFARVLGGSSTRRGRWRKSLDGDRRQVRKQLKSGGPLALGELRKLGAGGVEVDS